MNKKDKEKARVHKDLDGMEFKVDSFGEISSTMSIDKLNKFLDRNVEDKKLKDRNDPNESKEGE